MTIPSVTDVSFPKAEGYNLQIDSQWWRTVAAPGNEIQLGSRDSLAQRIDQIGSENNPVLDLGYAWARTNLSGGAGLDWSPRELSVFSDDVALDAIRFWDSYGISIDRHNEQDQQYSIHLSNAFEAWGGSITDFKDMDVSKEYIFVADGSTVRWYDSWGNTTEVASDLLVSPIIAISASPNATVVAVCENGNGYAMRNYPTETTFSIAYTAGGAGDYDAKGIWYANGRFLASTFDDVDQSKLISIEWDGSAWTDATIDTAEGPFWSVVESGPAIVAACADGTLRSYTPTADDAALTLLPRSRTNMPLGEEPILLGSNSSILLVLTASLDIDTGRNEIRLYRSEVLDARFDFVIGQIQLVREWEHAGDHSGLVTRNMISTRDQILFIVNEENAAGNVDDEALWFYDIVTTGLHRHSYIEGIDAGAAVTFEHRVGIGDLTASEVILESDTKFQSEGRLIFPNLTFGLNTDISWLATVLEVSNLIDAGPQVELYYSTNPQAIHDFDDPSWTIAQRLSSQGSTNTESPLRDVKSRTLALQLRIYATGLDTQSPFVTRTAIRGIPAHRDFIMLIPVNISDYVSAPGRKPMRIPGRGNTLHMALLDLIGNNVEVELLDPEVSFRGILNNISEPVTYQPHRGSVTRYCVAEFRGQRVTAGQTNLGNEAVGIGLVGVSLAGVNDNMETV